MSIRFKPLAACAAAAAMAVMAASPAMAWMTPAVAPASPAAPKPVTPVAMHHHRHHWTGMNATAKLNEMSLMAARHNVAFVPPAPHARYAYK